MTESAAFAGSYADFKFVKTRSVCQVIIELPIEQADAFLKVFKAPQPGKERPVALALLHLTPSGAAPDVMESGRQPVEPQASPKAEGSGKPQLTSGERAVRKAGILCADQQFQEWLWRETPPKDAVPPGNWQAADWEEWTTMEVRHKCDVISRRELATNDIARAKFHALEVAFFQATGRMAKDPHA